MCPLQLGPCASVISALYFSVALSFQPLLGMRKRGSPDSQGRSLRHKARWLLQVRWWRHEGRKQKSQLRFLQCRHGVPATQDVGTVSKPIPLSTWSMGPSQPFGGLRSSDYCGWKLASSRGWGGLWGRQQLTAVSYADRAARVGLTTCKRQVVVWALTPGGCM